MSQTWRVACGLLLGLVVGVPLPADEVDDLVATYIKEKGIPGLSIGVVRDGELIKEAGYGLADVELEAPARADTIYEIGSITKMFTATAIMMLVEEGKIDLDAPISTYLDDLPETWRAATVRQLLTHTSGIPSYTSAADFNKLARNDHSRAEILALVADKPMDFEPGAKWSYCNTGYYLLGWIVEKASGRDFAAFLDDRILEPAGMSRTRPTNPTMIVKGRASGYGAVLGLVRVNRDPLTPSAAYAAGFLLSTVGDLAKWDAALRAESLLTHESYEAMVTPATLSDGSTHPYGFGWGTSRRAGHRNFSHGGGTAGFSTLLSRYPDDGLTVILLSNLAGAELGPLERKLASHYLPELDIANAEPIDDPDPARTEHLRSVLATLLGGEIDPDAFDSKMAATLATPSARATTREVASKGDLGAFDLLEVENEEGKTALRFRIKVGEATHPLRVVVDSEGKIIGMRIEPED